MKHILIFPPKTVENEYINNFYSIFKKTGINPTPFSFKTMLRFSYKGNFIFINWLENQTRNYGVLGLVIICGFLFLSKALGYKLLYVRHNQHSHGLSGKIPIIINEIAISIIVFFSKRTLCHGLRTSKKFGYTYLPHPLYKKTTPPSNTKPQDHFLIFGKITRYKKILEFLSAAPKENRYKIMGAFDKEYLNDIKVLINKLKLDVVITDGFIPDNVLAQELSRCKAVISTNDGGTAIVSGVIFHCLSNDIPIIILKGPMSDEVGKSKGLHTVSKWEDISKINLDSYSDIRNSALEKASDSVIVSILKKVLE